MSVLSLPFDKLNRLHLAIRLNQTPGALSFSLESISPIEPSSSSQSSSSGVDHQAIAENASYCMNFQTGHDERGPVLKIFSSCVDSSANQTANNAGSSPPPSAKPSPSFSSPTLASSTSAQAEPSKVDPPFTSIFPSQQATGPGYMENTFFDQTFNNSDLSMSSFCGSLLSCLDTTIQQPQQSALMQKDEFLPNNVIVAGEQPAFWQDDSFLQTLDMDTSCASHAAGEMSQTLFSDHWLSMTPSSSASSLSSAPSSAASSTSSRSSSPSSEDSDLPISSTTPEPTSDSSSTASTSSPTASPSTKRHDRYDRRRFPCPIPGCNRRFTSQYTLKVHVKAHRPKPRPCFPCTLGCNEQFSRQHDRLRHEVAKHRKVCEWSCNECGRFFSSSKTLGNHKCKAVVGKSSMRWMSSGTERSETTTPS